MRTRPWAVAVMAVLSLGAVVLAQSPASDAPPNVRLGWLTLSGKQAGWRGIYPGKSRLDDVRRALGEPVTHELESDDVTRFIFPPYEAVKLNSVYADGTGLVRSIGWAHFTEDSRVPARDLIEALGEPKQISPISALGQGSTVQWEAAAVWGVMNRQTNAMLSLLMYDPAAPPQIEVPVARKE